MFPFLLVLYYLSHFFVSFSHHSHRSVPTESVSLRGRKRRHGDVGQRGQHAQLPGVSGGCQVLWLRHEISAKYWMFCGIHNLSQFPLLLIMCVRNISSIYIYTYICFYVWMYTYSNWSVIARRKRHWFVQKMVLSIHWIIWLFSMGPIPHFQTHSYLVGGLEHGFMNFHILGIIVPTDFNIFQRDSEG